jgi:hypothetical protein
MAFWRVSINLISIDVEELNARKNTLMKTLIIKNGLHVMQKNSPDENHPGLLFNKPYLVIKANENSYYFL